MSILLSLLIYFQRQSSLYCQKMGEKYQQDHVVNFNDKHSYVVGIPVSPSTLYVDHPLDNRAVQPPNELGIRRKNTTSFQITSVTVQGSRLNNEDFEDSADDFDESHTDDISSDILDSSRITEPDGYQSEDTCNTNCEDMSPCGPIIIAQLPSNNNESSINVGLGIGMSPTFSPMVSSGVTMMTSSSESPVNTQVPMINPLPDNWQHRFKVVKIVSSEPFKRGRWVCMDFVDPPTHSHNSNEKCDVPSIHVTSCNSNTQGSQHLNVGSAVAHVFEIPMNQSYPGVPSLNSQQNSQQFYGIILPQNSNPYQSINQVTLVQNVGSQTADYTNLNHLPELQNQNSQHQARTYSQLDNFLQNQINISTPASMPSMSMNQPRVITSNNMMDNVRSVSSANGHNSSFSVPNQVSFPVNISNSVDIQSNSVALNAVTVPPDKHTTASRSSMQNEDSESSQSIPEKLSVAELGQDLDPGTGSAASTGVNTVAIDNKIEQAMDLVKSHLMFAVREEVEVLKEKITELLERISQLEHENDILRANASPETLKQLNQSQKKNITGQSAHMLVGKQQKAPHMQVQPSSS